MSQKGKEEVIKRYDSKKDFWLVLLLWICVLLLVGSWVLIIRDHGWVMGLFWAPFMLGLAFLCLWVLRATYYELTRESLIIHAGPFKKTVPLKFIRKVYPTRCILSSAALSVDRLHIVRYSESWEIYISPVNKEDFMQTIKKLNEEIEIEL